MKLCDYQTEKITENDTEINKKSYLSTFKKVPLWGFKNNKIE